MRVLIACESNGKTRDAFIALGHDAISCDLLPTKRPGPHYQGDVRDILNEGWDLMIAHPDCTFLTCSAEWAYGLGPYHQKVKPETLVGMARREARVKALDFVRLLLNAKNIKKKAIENPRGVISTAIRPADQYIQPYQFGHDASKTTGLWLENLPKLVPTRYVPPRMVCKNCKGVSSYDAAFGKGCIHCGAEPAMLLPRWGNQTDGGQNKLTPGPSRWELRAETYQGWSDAMAFQWGKT